MSDPKAPAPRPCRLAQVFYLTRAAAFMFCDGCRVSLVGRNCWHWREPVLGTLPRRFIIRASCCVCWPNAVHSSEAA